MLSLPSDACLLLRSDPSFASGHSSSVGSTAVPGPRNVPSPQQPARQEPSVAAAAEPKQSSLARLRGASRPAHFSLGVLRQAVRSVLGRGAPEPAA